MKTLLIGNSQASSVKIAYETDKAAFVGLGDLHFYVIPGGHGPFLHVEDDLLVVDAKNDKFPPYAEPAHTPEIPLSSFDVFIVSALGYVDGGFTFKNPITTLATLPEFGPIGDARDSEYVSDRCYREMLTETMRNHHGFRLLKELRDTYDTRIIVQPFPYLSEDAQQNKKWGLREQYKDYLGMHRFLAEAKDSALQEICDACSVELLPYPEPARNNGYFTPANMMRDADCLHPLPEYSALVLQQIEQKMTAG